MLDIELIQIKRESQAIVRMLNILLFMKIFYSSKTVR